MKIEIKHSDALSMTINLSIETEDYADIVQKKLQDHRRKAEMKGFRKGMVPMGLIQKMYGSSTLMEEINKLLQESVPKYIEEQQIKMIGEPLLNEELTPQADWNHPSTFTFVLDLILAPKVALTLTADDYIPVKQPEITVQERDDYIESLQKKYGQLIDVEAAEPEDFLKVDLDQDDKYVNATYISLKSFQDEALKLPFIGIKAGDRVEIDILKTFPNAIDRAALLKIKKEELDDTNPLWSITVLEVKRYTPALLNQAFYDKLFGPGEVDSPEVFIQKVEERMRNDFAAESDYRFTLDARDYVINKCDLPLPDALIKRLLHHNSERKLSMEEIEKNWDNFARNFRWQLIRGHLLKEHHIAITKEEVMEQAVHVAKYRFASYGLSTVPQEQFDKYVQSLVDNNKEMNQIIEMVEEDRVYQLIRSIVTLVPEIVPFSRIREINTT